MKAHICIGGPLDGEFATTTDFQERPWNSRKQEYDDPGLYSHLPPGEYIQYNLGNSYRAPRNAPSMVWLHKDLLKSSISPKNR